MDEVTEGAPKAPYLPFQTFKSYLEELGSKPVPPMLDRTMMRGKSGTDQANLVSALQFFDFIDAEKRVNQSLREYLSLDENDRKHALATLLKVRYVDALKVSDQHGSDAMLADSFEKTFNYKSDTRRKAMTFFLHAARWSGMELSANFPATRMGSGRVAGSGAKRTNGVKRTNTQRKTKKRQGTRTPDAMSTTTNTGMVGDPQKVIVRFGDLGTVEIHIKLNVFEMPDAESSRLLKAVGAIKKLGRVDLSSAPSASTSDEDDGEDNEDEL